jgi:hypothetical protein
MATVNKNFRIKHGLVVEGSTATVNGQNVLTETGGDAYILNLVGGATLVKSVSSDFAVDGAGNLTINGSSDLARTGDITTAVNALDTDDIEEGASNLYHTAQRAKDAAAELLTNASTTNITITGTGAGLTITAENGVADSDTDDLTEGTTNLYFTNQRALDATASAYDISGSASAAQTAAENYADSLAGNYDPAGAALTAETNANIYTDSEINGLVTDDIEEGVSNLYFTNTRARGAISAGTGISYDSGTGVVSVDNTIATESYVNTAISNLVDGAPDLLNTLNEIAAAINDDANYFTTIANQIAGKQDTLTASTGITIDGSNNISVTANTYDAYGAASAAQTAAEATAQAALDDVLDATTPFSDININDFAKQVAARSTSLGSVVVTAYQFNKSTFKSGKFLVKIDNGTHNEISEILVTLDSSDNVAITEYAIVGTNGSRGTITADVDGTHCRIRVNPVNDSTITVAGTIFNA